MIDIISVRNVPERLHPSIHSSDYDMAKRKQIMLKTTSASRPCQNGQSIVLSVRQFVLRNEKRQRITVFRSRQQPMPPGATDEIGHHCWLHTRTGCYLSKKFCKMFFRVQQLCCSFPCCPSKLRGTHRKLLTKHLTQVAASPSTWMTYAASKRSCL